LVLNNKKNGAKASRTSITKAKRLLKTSEKWGIPIPFFFTLIEQINAQKEMSRLPSRIKVMHVTSILCVSNQGTIF
jgi:hypothetical protein